MDYYYIPLKTEKWHLLKKADAKNYTTTFKATSEMEIGDIALLYVGINEKEDIDSGVYAVGKIVSTPFDLTDDKIQQLPNVNEHDPNRNESVVEVEIKMIKFDAPLIRLEDAKAEFAPYQTPHIINSMDAINKVLIFTFD